MEGFCWILEYMNKNMIVFSIFIRINLFCFEIDFDNHFIFNPLGFQS